MNQGIYLIRCSGDNSVYVGQSADISKRKQYHFSNLKKGRHEVPTLQSSYALYGEDSFTFSVLEAKKRFDKSRRIEREDFWISHFRNDPTIILHNKYLNTEHPQEGTKHTIQTRIRQSEAKVGKEPHNKFPITDELLEDIKNGISYKAFEEKYGKSKNTLKRIKNELLGIKRVRIRHPELRNKNK